MSDPIIRYPLDSTGLSSTNLIQGEIHTLSAYPIRVVAPTYGAYFTESLVITDVVNATTLIRGTHYSCVELLTNASADYGKEICYLILITDPSVSSTVSIRYQVLGGLYGNTTTAIANLYNLIQTDSRPINWVSILNQPYAFTPTNHLHDLKDVYGFQYLVDSIERLRSAILVGSTPAFDNLITWVNTTNTNFQTTINNQISSTASAYATDSYAGNVKLNLNVRLLDATDPLRALTASGFNSLSTNFGVSTPNAVQSSIYNGLITALNLDANKIALGGKLSTSANNLLLGFNAAPSSGVVTNEITLGDANISKFRIPGLGISFTTNSGVFGNVTIGSGAGNTFYADSINTAIRAKGGGGTIYFQDYQGTTTWGQLNDTTLYIPTSITSNVFNSYGLINFSTAITDTGGATGIKANPKGWSRIDPNGSSFVITTALVADVNTNRVVLSMQDTTNWITRFNLTAAGNVYFAGEVNSARSVVSTSIVGNQQLSSWISTANGSNLTLNSASAPGSYMYAAAIGDTVFRTEANSLAFGTASSIKFGNATKEFAHLDTSGMTVNGVGTFGGGATIGNGGANTFYADATNTVIRPNANNGTIYFDNSGSTTRYGFINNTALDINVNLNVAQVGKFGTYATIGGAGGNTFYADSVNTAIRTNSATGNIYFQNLNGASIYGQWSPTELRVNNRLLLPNGAVTAPAIAFANDGSTDTGFYWGGDGYINVATNGVYTAGFSPGQLYLQGQLVASGDVVAYYSDDRLKERTGKIENALDKISTLDTFYYYPNQTAMDLGYEKLHQVGVSAQQVQAILPEVVKPAPIDNKYLTVQYEKIVPLLIAGINEQSVKITTLEDTITSMSKDIEMLKKLLNV